MKLERIKTGLNLKIVITIVWIILASLNLIGQDTLSFQDCMNRMLENNYRIKQQLATEQSYRLNIKKAQDARLPGVNANLNANSNWGRGIDPSTNTYISQQFNNYNGGISSDLTLFNGFYHINNIKLQKQDLEKNKSELQKIKNELLIDLVSRYTNVLFFAEQIKNAQSQIKLSGENIEQTQLKINAGVVAKREIHRFIAQRDNEELNLISAQNSLEQNLLEIKLLINEDPAKPIFIRDIDMMSQLLSKKQPIGEEHKFQISQFPSLQIARQEYEKSKTRVKLAKSSFYPTLNLGANLSSAYSTANTLFGFEDQIDNNRSMGLGLSAQIPIFNRFQTRNNVKEALINKDRSELNLQIETQNAYRTMLTAVNNLHASQKKYLVSTSALKSNQANYEADKIRMEAGRINFQELNTSKANYFNSLLNLTKDKYEWIFNAIVLDIYED
ncbi:MAG: TolC family protein, partial [Chitinophagales bacterium]